MVEGRARVDAEPGGGVRPRLAAAVLVLALLPAGGGAGAAPLDPGYRSWAKGPVRWLMLPEEERAFRRVRSDREAAQFIAAFWLRRDPDPERPGNPLYDRFEERVSAADRLYTEGRLPGSLTERGRALILLGPPAVVRLSQQSTPVWDPQRPVRGRRYAVRRVSVETWEYRPADLWPKLSDLVAADGDAGALTLTFVVEADRTRLTEGDRALRLAALATVGASE
jgi:GWxTD domain-containing protein